MRPVIGISSGTARVPVAAGVLPSHYLGIGYPDAVWRAGGLPLILPAVAPGESQLAEECIGLLDGLVLAGGTDIDPHIYGACRDGAQEVDPSRDRFEIALLDAAAADNVPVLGVCRGFQMINVWAGGSLAQHRPHTRSVAEVVDGLRVESTRIRLDGASRVGEMFDSQDLLVRCLHHQAVDRLGAGLRPVGRSEDGLIEALESETGSFVVGVLWHPEQMLESTDSIRPYEELIRQARSRQGASRSATTGQPAGLEGAVQNSQRFRGGP